MHPVLCTRIYTHRADTRAPMGQPAPLVSQPETGDGFDRPDLTGGEVAGGVVTTVGLHTTMRTHWYYLRSQRTTGARWPATMARGGAV